MFSYYGSKSKIVNLYPAPKYDAIIEPFAGSARYSLKYFEKDIYLYDKYDKIINLWKWLQKCSPKDILSLPRYKEGEDIRSKNLDCDEQLQLLRFLLQQGTVGGFKAYKWGIKSYESNLKQISNNLYKIKHWNIRLSDYSEMGNDEATWFIDAPYQFGGHKYKINNKKIDYNNLRDFCQSRKGQIITCENIKATWMEFTPIAEMQGIKFKTTEAVNII